MNWITILIIVLIGIGFIIAGLVKSKKYLGLFGTIKVLWAWLLERVILGSELYNSAKDGLQWIRFTLVLLRFALLLLLALNIQAIVSIKIKEVSESVFNLALYEFWAEAWAWLMVVCFASLLWYSSSLLFAKFSLRKAKIGMWVIAILCLLFSGYMNYTKIAQTKTAKVTTAKEVVKTDLADVKVYQNKIATLNKQLEQLQTSEKEALYKAKLASQRVYLDKEKYSKQEASYTRQADIYSQQADAILSKIESAENAIISLYAKTDKANANEIVRYKSDVSSAKLTSIIQTFVMEFLFILFKFLTFLITNVHETHTIGRVESVFEEEGKTTKVRHKKVVDSVEFDGSNSVKRIENNSKEYNFDISRFVPNFFKKKKVFQSEKENFHAEKENEKSEKENEKAENLSVKSDNEKVEEAIVNSFAGFIASEKGGKFNSDLLGIDLELKKEMLRCALNMQMKSYKNARQLHSEIEKHYGISVGTLGRIQSVNMKNNIDKFFNLQPELIEKLKRLLS